jgi:hypothetical protein
MMTVKKISTIVATMIAMHLFVACSSTDMKETRQWQPATITDFKSVAGKWEGLLVRDPRTPNDDWVTFIIGDTGAYEFVSPRLIGVFSGKGQLSVSDGKLVAKSEKGGQMTLQLYTDAGGSGERILRTNAKDGQGFTYTADLKSMPAKS